MNKQKRGVGLPYLQSCFEVDWNPAPSLAVKARSQLLQKIADYLAVNSFVYTNSESAEESSTSQDKGTGEFRNDTGCIGLQSVFDAMFAGCAALVLIDSQIVQPSAVGRCIALYASNCQDTTKVFAMDGLSAFLSPLLNRKAVEAIAFKKTSNLTDSICQKLSPVSFKFSSEPTLFRSSGKVPKPKD